MQPLETSDRKMYLETILERISKGIVAVDSETNIQGSNRRTGEIYDPGVVSILEPQFVQELTTWWLREYPHDFKPKNSLKREVPYEGLSRASCDLEITTDNILVDGPEWSIEMKKIALIGNNGKNNDYGVQKMLSPYKKDRSLIHDMERLANYGNGRNKAVIGYCFDYSFQTCKEAEKQHPDKSQVISEIREVCRKNDPLEGKLSVMPMVEFANEIFLARKLVKPVIVKPFKNAWRHPCGGSGYVWAWELI